MVESSIPTPTDGARGGLLYSMKKYLFLSLTLLCSVLGIAQKGQAIAVQVDGITRIDVHVFHARSTHMLQKHARMLKLLVRRIFKYALNHRQLFIPRGFAHGFCVLSEEVIFQYKCDNYYAPESEGAIRWDDSDLGIEWGIPAEDVVLSDKDRNHPGFKELEDVFFF